jgi:hypothetical protein
MKTKKKTKCIVPGCGRAATSSAIAGPKLQALLIREKKMIKGTTLIILCCDSEKCKNEIEHGSWVALGGKA